VKTDSPDLSRRVVVALVVDEVVSEAGMVLVVVLVASVVAGEDLVDMEAVVVEVLAVVDMVDLPLVATTLVAHRCLQTRSLTSQLPVRKKAKRFMFAMFVSHSFLYT
jgi:hypothetical protein